MGFVYLGKESIAIPVPCLQQFDFLAGSLSPGVAIGQRRIETESNNAEGQEDNGTEAPDQRSFTETDARNTSSNIVVNLAKGDDCKV